MGLLITSSSLDTDKTRHTLTANDMTTNFIDEDDDGPFTGTIHPLKKGENNRKSSIIIEAEGAEYQISYKLSRNPNR